jgi:murein DD-endopeptidase MepM/ murein hydrolase activator NlpD
MRQRNGAVTTFFAVLIAFGGFGYAIWSNAQPATPLRPIVPTMPSPTVAVNTWQEVLKSGFSGNGTPIPTVNVPDGQFVPPTLAPQTGPSETPLVVAEIRRGGEQVFVAGATPTPPPPTSDLIPLAAGGERVIDVSPAPVRATSLPSLNVPLSRDPMGRDHYWFKRPVAADSVNYGSSNYEYGTDGPKDSPMRIHTGIDIANPIGTTVRAAGDGVVIFATDPMDPEQITFQNSPAYGRVVVIEHDYGFDGKPVYTLYAHLEGVLVKKGDRVETGQAIALMGNTGHASGPHVHFEVRLFENRYANTFNPVLWMAPYVGHGTIAGRVIGDRGEFIDDVDVQIVSGGLVRDTTTTYVFRGSGSEVNPDPNWQENFVFFDVPVGRYRVQALVNGEQVWQVVEVREGQTTGVELKPNDPVPMLPTATVTP